MILFGLVLVPVSTALARYSDAAAQPAVNTPAPASTAPAAAASSTGISDDCSTPTAAAPTAAPTPTPKAAVTQAPPQGARAASQATAATPSAPLQTATQGPALPYTLETLTLTSKNLEGAQRIIQVYLPGGYDQNPTRRYPVLYVFDGQQLPEIGFEGLLNQLTSASQVNPFIVVAVFSTEGDLRREELGTGSTLNMFGWGTSSEAFNQFLVTELVPKINSTYHTLAGPQNTGVMGWSLGGLTAFYVAWQYPQIFGIVGAFSPSFWWRTPSQPGEELAARVIPNLVRDSAARPGLRMWFEAGTKELPYSDIDNNGVEDMIQDVQDVMSLLGQKGYQNGSDMVYVEVEGGQHELSTWETVMPDFLKYAFPLK